MSDEQPLTVRQLIELLRNCDPDAPVMIECEDGYYSGPLTESDVALTGYSVHRYGAHRGKSYVDDNRGKLIEKERDYPAGTIVASDKKTLPQDRPWIDSRPCVVFEC